MTYHHLRALRPAAAPPAARPAVGHGEPPGPVTLALRAMREAVEAPPRTGPVTEAIRTMRSAAPGFDADPDLRALRRAIADRIEADLAVLDAIGGDADDEPSLCGVGSHFPWGNRPELPKAGGGYGASPYDLEGEDEHGGDIQDEPHDAEEDDDRDSGIGDGDGLAEQVGGTPHSWACAV